MITDPRIGTELAGYRIDSVLGRGGMGVVYVARHLRLDRTVALKVLSADLAGDRTFRDRFVRESRLAASLEHPNIVPIYDAGEAEETLYLAMRLVQGTDLKRLIDQEGRLDPARTLRLLRQVAEALDSAHRAGLVHRDVKPGNVLIGSVGTPGEHAYLSDFGLTKRLSSDSGLTGTGQFVGTLDYAAPEQFAGKPLDARTDVYSLGCVLCECLTGQVPFPREQDVALMYAHLNASPPRVTEQRPELSRAIDEVVAKAMAKHPEGRYRRTGELAEGAAQALRVEGAGPTPKTRSLVLSPRRSPLVAAVAAGLAVVGLVVGLVVAIRGSKSPTSAPTTEAVDYLARTDPRTSGVVAKIPVGKHPIDVAVGEGSVWVLDGDGSVRRIDPVTNKVILILGVAEDPRAIAAGEGGLWVADGIKRTVHVIDPASNRVRRSMTVSGVTLDVTAGEGAVWVATPEQLVEIDPSSGRVTELGGSFGVSFDITRAQQFRVVVGNGFVWRTWSEVSTVVRHDVMSGGFQRFDLGIAPRDIAINGSDVWLVACGIPGTVIRLDSQAGRVSASIPAGGAVCPYFTGGNPISIAAGKEGVWVTDAVNQTVSRIDETSNQVEPPIRIGDTLTAVTVGLGSVWVTVDGEVSPSRSTSSLPSR
jgi:serine/threonine protein kinase